MAPKAKPATLTLEQRITNIETILKWLRGASGISMVVLLGFAFWLGNLSAKVSSSSETINRVYGAVSENKDSLQSRTSVIESKLTSIDARLASMDANLTDLVKFRERTSVTIKPIPSPPPEQ